MNIKLHLFFAFLFLSVLANGQTQIAEVAAMASKHLADKNYTAALQSYNLLLKDDFFNLTKKLSGKEKKDKRKVIATFEFRRANALAYLGKYQEGLKGLEAAELAHPESTLFRFYKAMYKDNFFDNDIDIDAVKKWYKPFQGYANTASLLALAYERRGMYEDALDMYNKALKKDKSPENYYKVAEFTQLLGKEKDAKKLYKKGLAAFPTAPSPENYTFEDIQILHQYKLGETEKGLAIGKRLTEENPMNLRAQKYLAELLFYAKKYEASIAAFETILADNPFSEKAFIFMAKGLHESGQTDKALETLDKLIEEFPNYFAAYTERAAIYKSQGNMKHAEADMEKAKAVIPYHPMFNKDDLSKK